MRVKLLRDHLSDMAAFLINHSLQTAPKGVATVEKEVLPHIVSF